jgi:hypothetical protein
MNEAFKDKDWAKYKAIKTGLTSLEIRSALHVKKQCREKEGEPLPCQQGDDEQGQELCGGAQGAYSRSQG